MVRRRGEDRRRRPPDRAREGHPRGRYLSLASLRPARATRRGFLAGVSALAACRRDGVGPPLAARCGDPLPFTFVGALPILDGGDRPLEERYGEGLDARYVVDLEQLDPDGLVVPGERFYLRTGAPDDLDEVPIDAISLTGRVVSPRTLTLDELLGQVVDIGDVLLECSGNGDGARFGLMSAGSFAGVPLSWVMSLVEPDADAVAIRVTGRDTHPASTFSTLGASWVYRLDELDGAFLATHQDGLPLLPDHGYPARLLVPGWYGCANIKWVEALAWVGDDEPATTQMTEFAERTHQDGVPLLARDYAPAEIEVAATVVRVEAWRVDGQRHLRAIGVVWGGRALPPALELWLDGENLGAVSMCPREDVRTWALWEAALPAWATGVVSLALKAPGSPARRLDTGYYTRNVDLGS